jgi:hypothetical protein
MVEQSQLNCPQCGQIDAVSKVSALYTSGIAASEGQIQTPYGRGTTSTFSQTGLSLRLKPPIKPFKANVAMWIVPIFFLVLGVIMVGNYIYFVSTLMNGVLTGIPDTANLISGLFFSALGLALLIYFISLQKSFPQRYQVWAQKMHLYDELFYCGRCDGVFSVNDRRFTRVDDMQDYMKSK